MQDRGAPILAHHDSFMGDRHGNLLVAVARMEKEWDAGLEDGVKFCTYAFINTVRGGLEDGINSALMHHHQRNFPRPSCVRVLALLTRERTAAISQNDQL